MKRLNLEPLRRAGLELWPYALAALACMVLIDYAIPGTIPPEPSELWAEQIPDSITYGAPRSSKWTELRNRYVAEHPRCEACGSTRSLNVHHVAPFHLHPELELDPTNLITLCREHHFRLGHHRDWKYENLNCRKEVAAYRRAHPWN